MINHSFIEPSLSARYYMFVSKRKQVIDQIEKLSVEEVKQATQHLEQFVAQLNECDLSLMSKYKVNLNKPLFVNCCVLLDASEDEEERLKILMKYYFQWFEHRIKPYTF